MDGPFDELDWACSAVRKVTVTGSPPLLMSEPTMTPGRALGRRHEDEPAGLHVTDVDVDPVGRLVLDRGLRRRLRGARGEGAGRADEDRREGRGGRAGRVAEGVT